MRQVGDTLVWLGVILIVAAVVYFTPRFASYVTASESQLGRGKVAWSGIANPQVDPAD
jgi:hypothetical protein